MARALRVALGCAVVLVVGSLLIPTVALADTGTPAQTTSNPVLTGSTLLWALVYLCVFGIALVAAILWFTKDTTDRFYEVYSKLSSLGHAPAVRDVSTFSVPAAAAALVAPVAGASPTLVKGPGALAVGEAGTYSATVNDTPAPSIWVVEPATAAAVNPSQDGNSASVVPASTGVFKVTATPQDGSGHPGTLQVAAIAAATSDGGLPFFGVAWGTLLIVLTLLIVVLIASLAGVFTSALATLAGGVLGYIFTGQAANTPTANPTGGGSGGSGSGAP